MCKTNITNSVNILDNIYHYKSMNTTGNQNPYFATINLSRNRQMNQQNTNQGLTLQNTNIRLLDNILRTRRIYENIVENIRAEDAIIQRMLPSLLNTNNRNISYGGTTVPNYFAANINVPHQHLYGGQNTQQGSILPNLFVDITNLLFGHEHNDEDRGMTNEQITAAVDNCIYSDLSGNIRERYTTCPVTLEQFENDDEVSVIRTCGHVFRRQALSNWLSTRHTCPTCRQDLIRRSAAVQRSVTDTSGNRQNLYEVNTDISGNMSNRSLAQTDVPQMALDFGNVSHNNEEINTQMISLLRNIFNAPVTNEQSQNDSSDDSSPLVNYMQFRNDRW